MTLGALLFVLCATLLLISGGWLLLIERLSAVVHLALAGYASIAAYAATALETEFGSSVYLTAATIYLTGTVTLTLLSGLLSTACPARPLRAKEWGTVDFERHAALCTAAALVALALLAVGRDDLLATWSEARFDAGPVTTLGTFMLLIACPGIVSAVLLRRALLASVLVTTCVLGFVLSGSRATILAAIGLGIWLAIARTPGRWGKVKILVLAAVVSLAFHVLMRQIRGLGLGGLLDAYQSGDLLHALFHSDADADVSGGEAAITRYFLFATQASSTQDFGFLTSVLRLVLLPIPRVEGWFDKPVDVTYLLWEQALLSGVFSDAVGQQTLLESYLTGSLGSLHATAFGEYFASGAWWGLILSSMVLAIILAGIDWVLGRASRVTALAMTGPMLVGFLFVARGNSVIGLGYFFYLGILFLLLKLPFDSVRWLRPVQVPVRRLGRCTVRRAIDQ